MNYARSDVFLKCLLLPESMEMGCMSVVGG